jgi:group II intron reverse transcriptase/maturase
MHALMHHLSEANLKRAFRELKGSKARGIDQVSKQAYQRDLDTNIHTLWDCMYRGGWRPQPSREVLIPKPRGGKRPLAVGCIEDKVVQLLVARILEAIYEPMFHRNSFGFRRGKSAHQAVRRLYRVINQWRDSCVVVEVDIEKFFNSMDHNWLMERLQTRISDPRFLRLIRRMLRNSILGVDGEIRANRRGTPQGSPVSPILANIYLHYLIDEWFEEHIDRGEMIRYADDVVYVFPSEDGAQSFYQELVQRMSTGGLGVNHEKSRIVHFDARSPRGNVNLLGFTFYWGRDRRRRRVLKVKTSSKSLRNSMKAFSDWIKHIRNRKPLKYIWAMAAAKLRGHYNYFGVTFNQRKLGHYYSVCIKALYKWLNRRSQKRSFAWERFMRKLAFDPLPRPPMGFELLEITYEHGTGRNTNRRAVCVNSARTVL